MPIEEVNFVQRNDDGKRYNVKLTGDQFAYVLWELQDFGSFYRYIKGHAEWELLDD